jgi:hypothetical protein
MQQLPVMPPVLADVARNHPMSQRTFLFIHGYTGSGPDHWQRWLSDRPASLREDVCIASAYGRAAFAAVV